MMAPVLLVAFVGWLRYRYRIATVRGPSMRPTLHDGDRVLVRRTGATRIRRGDIVLARTPAGWILKRVTARPGDPAPPGLSGPVTGFALFGDNPQWSIDSRDFGYVPADGLYGVVVRPLMPVRS